jgi:hypothetical protein
LGCIYRKASAIVIWSCVEEVDTDNEVAMNLLTNLSSASEDWGETDAGTAVINGVELEDEESSEESSPTAWDFIRLLYSHGPLK